MVRQRVPLEVQAVHLLILIDKEVEIKRNIEAKSVKVNKVAQLIKILTNNQNFTNST